MFKHLAEDLIGKYVKIKFKRSQDNPSAENMWILVDAIEAGGVITGTLDSPPVFCTQLSRGDRCHFWLNDIMAVMSEPN